MYEHVCVCVYALFIQYGGGTGSFQVQGDVPDTNFAPPSLEQLEVVPLTRHVIASASASADIGTPIATDDGNDSESVYITANEGHRDSWHERKQGLAKRPRITVPKLARSQSSGDDFIHHAVDNPSSVRPDDASGSEFITRSFVSTSLEASPRGKPSNHTYILNCSI